MKANATWRLTPEITVDILYESPACVVLNKPPHVLVIPDHWDKDRPNLIDLLNDFSAQTCAFNPTRDFERWYVVHRLDAETSGALIMAKTATAHAALCRQFEEGSVQKTYLAIVDGHPADESGVINKPLLPHPAKKGLMIIAAEGKPAQTEYRLLEKLAKAALIELKPRTGRTHQIRVHLASIGHPLLIDARYGRRKAFFLSEIKRDYRPKTRDDWQERPLIERLTLHAAALAFEDPASHEAKYIAAPTFKDWDVALKQLRRRVGPG